MLACSFCAKDCKSSNSLKNHERCCPNNPNRNYKNGMSGKSAWNKGLNKEDVRVKTLSEKLCGKKHPGFSKEALEKLSSLAKERGLGGYRPHPNKGLYYNGIWFDSKWEVQVAQSLDENNISWERPRVGYTWTNCGRKYYPDFYLKDYDVFLDPKNSFLRKKDQEKIDEAQRRNLIKVIILDETQLSWERIKELL